MCSCVVVAAQFPFLFPFRLLLFGRIQPLSDLLPPREIKEGRKQTNKGVLVRSWRVSLCFPTKQNKTGCLPAELWFGIQALEACREIFIKAAWELFLISAIISLRGISTHSHLGAAQFNHSCALLGADSFTGAYWKLNQQPQNAKPSKKVLKH